MSTSKAPIMLTAEQWEALTAKLDEIQSLLKNQPADQNENINSVWMDEEQTCKALGLSSRSLYDLRIQGALRYSTASGRKIKYFRSDVEKHLNENSNVKSRRRK